MLKLLLLHLHSYWKFNHMSFFYTMGRPTVSEILEEVCQAIWEIPQPMWMPKKNEDTWRASEKLFNEKWNFPYFVAALYDKHMHINVPTLTGSQFYNYKKYYSITLRALVYDIYKFLTIDVGQYEWFSDGNGFGNSKIAKWLNLSAIGPPPNENVGGHFAICHSWRWTISPEKMSNKTTPQNKSKSATQQKL